MKRIAIIFCVLWLAIGFIDIANANYKANQETCVAMCNAAAKMILEDGMANALCEISNKNGRFVRGSIFVYMMNMDAVMMAHPIVPSLIGKNLSGVVLKDKKGKEHPMMLVNVAKNKGAGWVRYMWPKPGENEPSEKTVYILKVEGTNVFLAACFYAD